MKNTPDNDKLINDLVRQLNKLSDEDFWKVVNSAKDTGVAGMFKKPKKKMKKSK